MRADVFKEYYKTMVNIINYKEKDAKGNERKCTVSVAEAKQHPERYTIYEFQHQALEGQKFAFDPELVKKHADTLKELSLLVPSKYAPATGRTVIPLKDLLNDGLKTISKKDMILGESFLAMAASCNVLEWTGASFGNKANIQRTYKRKNQIKIS